MSVDIDKYRGFVNKDVGRGAGFVYSGHGCRDCRGCSRANFWYIGDKYYFLFAFG